MTIPVLLVSCLVALLSAFAFHDHGHRKAFVGSVGLVASVAMYGSPLVVMVSPFLLKFNMIIYRRRKKFIFFLGGAGKINSSYVFILCS